MNHFARIAAIAWLLTVAPAGAGLVNLIDLPPTSLAWQGDWGQPGTSLYAQSILADDVRLDQVGFYAMAIVGDVQFNLLITGARPVAGGMGYAPLFSDVRYNSGPLTLAESEGDRPIVVNPYLAVTPGERLFAVLDTFTHPYGAYGYVLSTVENGGEQYPDGEFVFLNTFTPSDSFPLTSLDTETWSHGSPTQRDLAFVSNFTDGTTAIPEPSSLVLLAIGASVAGASRRWRPRPVTNC